MRTPHNRARRITAEDHRGPQRPLALVVGRFDVTARQEHQQLVTRRHGNGRSQVAALHIGRLEVQQAIQLAVKAAPVRCDCAVGEIGPPVPDRAGILQERAISMLKCNTLRGSIGL